MATTHGFDLIAEKEISELNTLVRLYRHAKSAAELLSLSNDDENKVFGIIFRTPPSDSTGVAHIMEHAVLGGSRKYQVKEPFVELIKGSLNTFLNAFTSADWTAYPVASTNLQDFYNLIDVYLDAVFYPLITPHHLDQEGWHYELDSLDSPLMYKGVVFNEMKGVYSSPDDIFRHHNQRSLFLNHIYGFDSGGDPREIPNLTYEQFKNFHRTFYHPTNARIFFYGDDDPEQRLRILNGYLKEFGAQDVNSLVPRANRYEQPRRFSYPFIVDPESNLNRKGRVQVNWLLPENNDPTLTMALNVLSFALVSTPASPLRKALIDSGLGEEITGGGLAGNLRESIFGIGLKGINVEDASQVETLILDTLQDLSQKGLEREMIKAAVNSIEFQLRENNTGPYPRGLGLMLRALTTWLYDGDPMAMLAYEAPLEAVKEQLDNNPDYLKALIRIHLLENTHRTSVTLKPDPTLGRRTEEEEQERLAKAKSDLNETELKAIMTNMHELKLRQETPDRPEALAAIPTLTLEDLEKHNKLIPIAVEEEQGTEILFHDLFTNGIVYFDVGFNLHTLPADLLHYVNLFGNSLTKMGTETEDYVKLSQHISRKTGGMWHTALTSTTSDRLDSATWLFLRGKSTMAQAQEMLDIYRDILLNLKLDDQDRFRQIGLEAKAREEAGLVRMGHVVARNRLAAQFNEADWAAEQIGGIAYLFFLNQLEMAIDKDWPMVLEKLEAVRRALINRYAMVLNVTLDDENFQAFKPQLRDFLISLPANRIEPSSWSPNLDRVNEGLTIPTRVNFISKGTNLYDLGYQINGSIGVITKYLRSTWLWEKVRVQGGAYGGSCSFDRYSGVFGFMSYRDPNLMATIHTFDQTAEFLRNLELSDDELVKAIIGAIGDYDAYQLPDAKGYTSMIRHLVGVTEESRQQYRDEILSTTQKEFKAIAEILDGMKENGQVVVMGSPESIESINESNWLDVRKVL